MASGGRRNGDMDDLSQKLAGVYLDEMDQGDDYRSVHSVQMSAQI